jgi:hypothetical protein
MNNARKRFVIFCEQTNKAKKSINPGTFGGLGNVGNVGRKIINEGGL